MKLRKIHNSRPAFAAKGAKEPGKDGKKAAAPATTLTGPGRVGPGSFCLRYTASRKRASKGAVACGLS